MPNPVERELALLKGLNAVYRALAAVPGSEPSLRSLLNVILQTSVSLTGARYGALGVFDETGERLADFLTTGLDEETRKRIGPPPTGRGVLGTLAKEPGALRIKNLATHAHSVGFPPHHPPMTSFLGVSIRTGGKLFGRIYLTDKQGAEEFSEIDEEVVCALAAQARTTIERQQLFDQVSASEERYRLILQSVVEGIYGIDRAGRCMFINRSALRMFGYGQKEVLGQEMHALVCHARPDGSPYLARECKAYRVMETGRECRSEAEVLWRRDGTSFPVECSISPIVHRGIMQGAVIVFADITERRLLEEQLRQSQKMEAIGRLAGGVAHDFNNLLTVINGYAQVLLSKSAAGAPGRRELEDISRAGERAVSLTNQLLAFSRKQLLSPRVLDLNQVVAGMDRMLRRLIGEDIDLWTVLNPDLWNVNVDPGQIDQIIMNLAVNARDAMPRGGRLTIETANVELDETYTQAHVGVQPGPYVMLAVSDNGEGMGAETKARIFEPFFTTKEPDKGTGLGLSTVYGIVKQSGGHIWLYSERGRGTTFKVYLPRVMEGVTAQEKSPATAETTKGTETILLVEDEDMVRSLLKSVLEADGYTVLDASNGADAVRLFRQYAAPIHLLVTDVVMPGMTGKEVATSLRAQCPSLKVLYMSGYTDNAIVHHGVLEPGIEFLHKPFGPTTLSQKVRAVIRRAEC
jgi:PAS domain S-box-containing protein